MMALRSEILTRPDDLTAIAAAWNELLADSATNEPALSFDWLATWWEVFGSTAGRRLLVELWYDGARLVGLVPLQRRRVRYLGLMPFARLELLGSGEPERDEVCSEYLNPLVRRGYEGGLAPMIAASLARRDDWDEMVLPSLDGTQPVASLLKGAFEALGYRTECVQTSACPYVPLPKTWEAYLSALPSQRRYLVTRSLRDFEQWAQGRHVLRRATTPTELEEGSTILFSLHAERWSEQGESGAFASDRFRKFHELLMPKLLDRGALDLWWLEVERRPVAAVYNFVWDNKVHFYQSGRARDVPGKVRIGIVAHALVMQRAIAEGRREYDFLAGTSQYKMQMALATRPLWRIRVARSHSLEWLRQRMERPRRLARAVAGRQSPLWPALRWRSGPRGLRSQSR